MTLLHDARGDLAPKASILYMTGSFIIHTDDENFDDGALYPTIDAAISAAEEKGFEAIGRGFSPNSHPYATLRHIETQAAVDAKR